MKGFRYLIGQAFLNAEDQRFERASKMPMDTVSQREDAYTYRQYGFDKESYDTMLALSHAYAKERSKNPNVYAFNQGMKFRLEILKTCLVELVCYIMHPYKRC